MSDEDQPIADVGAQQNKKDEATVNPDQDESEQDSETEDTASLETQVEELKESFLRAQAELQNLRRRGERDVENAHKYAIERFVKDFLPVIDSMDKALEIAESTEGFDDAMLKGIQFTHKLMDDVYQKHGIVKIDPVGEPFDPQQHQAMSMVESIEYGPNTVISVMQKGYLLEGRVLRAAMVVVSTAPSE